MTDKKTTVFIVDDDALFLKSLEIEFLQNADFIVETYATGELCIANLSHRSDVVILDYHLDGLNKDAMNGIEILDKIAAFNGAIPVIMLSSQDKIDVAVNCMRHNAYDYVVKSSTAFIRLQKIIVDILQYKKIKKELNWYMDRM